MIAPNILYFGSRFSDFMSDSIFHGLRSLLGELVVDVERIDYMYQSASTKAFEKFHGKGFTLAGKLPDISIDRTDIEKKIKLKYFDFIIIGVPYRVTGLESLIKIVYEYYEPRKIIFINGNDSDAGNHIPPDIPGIHFLRERYVNDSTIPISFSIPSEIIVKEVSVKTNWLMPLIPSRRETYVYNTEEEYYEAYRNSMFGITHKKAGWDCLRHYEILSQGCVPLFVDIAHLPQTMMVNYPRKTIENVLDIAIKIKNYSKNMQFEYNDGRVGRFYMKNLDFSTIEFSEPDRYGYYEIAENLLEHTKKYLTTEFTAKFILEKINI